MSDKRGSATHVEWESWWMTVASEQTRVAPLTAFSCSDLTMCVMVDASSGDCICKKNDPAPAPAPAPVPAADGWTKHSSRNCYPKHGAEIPGDGNDPYNPDTTLEECQDLCMKDDHCFGIVFRQHFAHGPCFLRSNIVLDNCVQNDDWDTWEKTTFASVI